jgi:uncharacterized protein YdcH (DUF465 family)
MTRTDQSSVCIQVNADWYLKALRRRHAALFRLRDEVEQLSREVQRMESSAQPAETKDERANR